MFLIDHWLREISRLAERGVPLSFGLWPCFSEYCAHLNQSLHKEHANSSQSLYQVSQHGLSIWLYGKGM